jgi:hypothetical protein
LIEETAPRRVDTSGHWICDQVHISKLTSQEALETLGHLWLARIDITDPNNGKVIGSLQGGLTLTEFNIVSRYWRRVEVPPQVVIEPNEPVIIEPNEPDISNVCFSVGGKHHLFIDCSYMTGKLPLIVDCNPNDICLRCAARKLSELQTKN